MKPKREDIQQWIEWTRANLPRNMDIPSLDWGGPKAERAQDGGDSQECPPWQEWTTEIFNDASIDRGEDLRATFAQVMRDARPDDLGPRFTALHFYYTLAIFEPGYSMFNQELSEEAQIAFLDDLRMLVNVLPVEECPHEGRRITWEISNAVAAEDWDRLRRLFQIAEAFLSATEVMNLWLTRGRINFFRAFGKSGDKPQKANFWMLITDPTDDFGADLTKAYQAALVEGPERIARRALTKGTQELLRDARNDLEKAFQKRDRIHASHHAILGTCYFALGDYGKAADEYRNLLAQKSALRCLNFDILLSLINKSTRQPGEDDASLLVRIVKSSSYEVVKNFKPDLLNVFAKSHALAGEPTKAESVYRQWEQEYPNDPRVYRNIAELLARQAKYQEAYEALRKEVDLIPDLETEPPYKIALALGAIAAEHLDVDKVTQQIISYHPEVDNILDLALLDLWPAYRKMSCKIREIWRFASVQSYYGRHVQPALASQFRQTGAEKFAKVVEIELRQRVFEKFRSEAGEDESVKAVAEQAKSDQEAGLFAKFLVRDGRLTLGQMAFILRKANDGDGELFMRFRDWTRQLFPHLDSSQVKLLSKISVLRNRETHTSVSLDVSAVPGLCCEFLQALLANVAIPEPAARSR